MIWILFWQERFFDLLFYISKTNILENIFVFGVFFFSFFEFVFFLFVEGLTNFFFFFFFLLVHFVSLLGEDSELIAYFRGC